MSTILEAASDSRSRDRMERGPRARDVVSETKPSKHGGRTRRFRLNSSARWTKSPCRVSAGNSLDQLFDRFLMDAQARALREGLPLSIRVSPEARRFILERSRHNLFGPWRLCRAMEAALVEPLLRLVRAHALEKGDAVDVMKREARLVFYRNRRRDRLTV